MQFQIKKTQWLISILLKIRILCYDRTNFQKIRQIKSRHDRIDLTNPLRSYNGPELDPDKLHSTLVLLFLIERYDETKVRVSRVVFVLLAVVQDPGAFFQGTS